MDVVLCRACLIPQGTFKHSPIFTENGKIATEIFKLTNLVTLDLSDLNCPAVICQRCLMDLERATSFRELIIKSDEHLRELFSHKISKVLGNIRNFSETESKKSKTKDSPHKTNGLTESQRRDRTESSRNSEDLVTLIKEEKDDYKCVKSESLTSSSDRESDFLDEIDSNFQQDAQYSNIHDQYPSNSTANHNEMYQNFTNFYTDPQSSFQISSEFDIHQIKQEENQSEFIQEFIESPKPKRFKRCYEDPSVLYPTTNLTESESTELQCNICYKKFSRKCYLTQHFQTVHMELKPFRCTKCGKRYASLDILNSHLQKHGDNKPFKCQMCSKSFNHKADLKRHEMGHSIDKPFKCTLCDKGFVRNDQFTKHILMHQKKMKKDTPLAGY